MANGQSLLPVSALPVGQTPLATIQQPNVPVSVPNPIDVTNFFRMQQGIQNNLGVLQNAEELKMRRQQMDLRNYERTIKEMDAIMGMANGAFSDFYNREKSKRDQNSSSLSPLFGGLDPTRSRHADVTRRMNSKVDAAQAEIDQLVKGLIGSGSVDPATQFETTRNIRNVTSKTRQEMEQDSEYFELSRMHRAYNDFLDGVNSLQLKGANVDLSAIDQLKRDYDQWTEDGSGNISLNRFNISDYVYDAGDVLKRMASDAKSLGTGITEFEEVSTSQGGLLEGERTTRRSLDDISEAMEAKYSNDKGARAIFNNAVRGKKKENGDDYEFVDWMRDLSAPYAPADGKESVISGTGSILIKPGSDETDPSSGGARSTSKKGGYDNRGLVNVLGRKPYASEVGAVELGNTLQERGFDVTKGSWDLTPYDWSKLAALDKKNRLEIVDVDIDGAPVARGKGDYIALYDKGFTNEDGEVEIPRKLVGEFPKAAQTQEGVDAVPAPKGSVYQHKMRSEPLQGDANTPAVRNNNPGNVKPNAKEKAAWNKAFEENGGDWDATAKQLGYGVRGEFLTFDTLEKGIDHTAKDIHLKLDGKSGRFDENPHLIEKYGKENLGAGKYLDVATVEDFMHVYSPKNTYKGGDNSPKAFEAKLKLFEKRGFPRDLKLKDLQDRANFVATMIESEDKVMYDTLYGEGGYLPAAHKDEVTVVEDATDPITNDLKEKGYVPPKQATFTAEGLSRNTMDRLILGDDDLTEEELTQFFNTPPPELKRMVDDVRNKWEDRSRKEEQLRNLLAKQSIAQEFGQDLSETEKSSLSNLQEEIVQLDADTSVSQIGNILRAEIAKDMEPQIMDASIKELFLGEGMKPGATQSFMFKEGIVLGGKATKRGEPRGVVFMKSSTDSDTYGMRYFKLDEDGNRTYVGDVDILSGEDAVEKLKSQLVKYDEASAMQLLNPERVDAFLRETAQKSIESRGQALQNLQYETNESVRASNDVNSEVDDTSVAPTTPTVPAQSSTALSILRNRRD